MHTLLALETATNASSVALYHNNRFYERVNFVPKTHSEQILPMVQALLDEAGIKIQQVEHIAVGVGPGSFTGVRVAVGLAQALGFGLDVPIWPISTLSALAYQGALEADCSDCYIAPIWDARMQGVYWGLYQPDAIYGLSEKLEDRLSTPAEALADLTLSKPLYTIGNGVQTYAKEMIDTLSQYNWIHLIDLYPHAKHVIMLAQKQIELGRSPVKPHLLVPKYIRDKVAEPSRKVESV